MRKFLPVLIITIVAACNQSQVDLKAEEAAILKTDSSWAALARESTDADKIASYWSDDAVVIAPGQPIVKGRDALRKMVEDSKNIPGFSITWRSSEVHFLSRWKACLYVRRESYNHE